MADRPDTERKGLPLRIEAYPSPGPLCARNPRNARALQVTELALDVATAAPERLGTVLRVRANEPIGPTERRELVTRVVDCQPTGDGQHRISLAILGIDRRETLRNRQPRTRYSVPVAS